MDREKAPKVNKLTRRGFLGGGAAFVMGKALDRFALPVYEQWRAWKDADTSNIKFFEEHGRDLENVAIGISFAPENFGISIYNFSHEENESKRKMSVDALKFAIDMLGIRDIRLGIRWNNVERNNKIDLSFYRPYLDLMKQRGVNVCLDIGYKTQGWPEEHPTEEAIEEYNLSENRKTVIKPDSPFGSAALDHVDRLTTTLLNEYGAEALDMVQPENESFHSFGRFGNSLSPDYMERAISIIHSKFPRASILVNTPRLRGVDDIRRLFINVQKQNHGINLVLGVNYHYMQPNNTDIPVIGFLGPLTIQELVDDGSVDRNIRISKEMGYGIEITEGQMDRWGAISKPARNAQAFRFMLSRAMRFLNLSSSSIIRVWGFEKRYQEMKNCEFIRDNWNMFELIQMKNGVSPALALRESDIASF